MPVFMDLTGKKVNSWEFISYVGNSRWLCLCACGTLKEVQAHTINSGKSSNCGCLRKAVIKEMAIGQVFGRLTVTSFSHIESNRAYWNFSCVCGSIVCVNGKDVRNGNTQSCGCLSKDLALERLGTINLLGINKGPNNYNWKGGISPLHETIRGHSKSKSWKLSVFERDNYTCQDCGSRGSQDIHAHHLDFFSHILSRYEIDTLDKAVACKELWDVSNGITLCKSCHKKKHNGGLY